MIPKGRVTTATLLAMVLAAAVVIAGAVAPARASQLKTTQILSQKYGKTQEEVAGVPTDDPEYSPFLPGSVPAFCVSREGAGGMIYLLDAANGRVKKFNLEGNFSGQFAMENIPKGVMVRGICVPAKAEKGEPAVTVYSDDALYRFPARGGQAEKIPAAGMNLTRVFAAGEKDYMVYDSVRRRMARVSVDGGAMRTEASFENVFNPWPADGGGVYSVFLPSLNECMVYSLKGPGTLPELFFRIAPRSGSQISCAAPIGADSAGNLYIRYFSNNAQCVLALTPAGKIYEEFTLDPKYTPGRASAGQNEAVDGEGGVYIAFVDSERYFIQKFVNQK